MRCVDERHTLDLGADGKQSIDDAGKGYNVANVSGSADRIADANELWRRYVDCKAGGVVRYEA